MSFLECIQVGFDLVFDVLALEVYNKEVISITCFCRTSLGRRTSRNKGCDLMNERCCM